MEDNRNCLWDDRRITLEHLRVFIAVAENGSFHNAGKLLSRSQPTITQSVQKLEDYLRCRLFERRQGHVAGLTSDGTRMLPEAREIVCRLDALVRVMLRPKLQGNITLGIPPSFRAAELQRAVSSCMALNKELRVRVITAMSVHLEEMLSQGRIDVAIVSRLFDGRAAEDKNIRHVLREDPLVWIANRIEHAQTYEEVPLVSFTEGSPWRKACEEALEAASISFYHAYVSASFESVGSAVSAGFGVSVLPLGYIDANHVVLGREQGFPDLPKVRCLLLASGQSAGVVQFCEILGQTLIA